MSFGETDAKDCTPLNKTEVATCEMGAGFPSSFRLRNQISGSQEGEETHAEGGPEGKVFGKLEVDMGTKSDEEVDGEVGLALWSAKVSANASQAPCQGREDGGTQGDLMPHRDVQGGERSKVSADGSVGVTGGPKPSGVTDEKLLYRREGRPLVGQEKPKEGEPCSSVGDERGVCQRGLYARDRHECQGSLSICNVWR